MERTESVDDQMAFLCNETVPLIEFEAFITIKQGKCTVAEEGTGSGKSWVKDAKFSKCFPIGFLHVMRHIW